MTALLQRLYFTSDPVAVIPLTMGHLHCVLSRQVTAKPLSHSQGVGGAVPEHHPLQPGAFIVQMTMYEFHHCEEVKGTIISVWKEQLADQWELRQKMPQRSHSGTCKIPNHHADVGGSIVETFCFQFLGSFSQVVIGVCEVKHVGLIHIGSFFSILATPVFARLIFRILLVTFSES